MDTTKPIRAHTILFTEDCPLDCRYCQLKYDDVYGTCENQTYEEILEKVQLYDEQDKKDGVQTQLTFTGGEPFLYWNWIKSIIEIYGKQFIYHFNTSGYLFTEENLEFLSNYQVHFTLSVDGGEKLGNYIRPVKGHPARVGYFKQIKRIAPTLTYYFPQTVCKLIVNNRYVDLLHQTYLDMEQVGFKATTIILDFNSRPSTLPNKQIQRLWDDNDTKILYEQLNLISKEIIFGFIQNKKRMRVTNFDNIIAFLLSGQNEVYSPENLVCKVFNGRTLTSMHDSKDRHCFAGHFDSLEEAKQYLIQGFNDLKGQCPIDKTCPAFYYCANNNCPISSQIATGSFFKSEHLECIMAKGSYDCVIKILTLCNEYCKDNKAYIKYINNFNYKGKEEAIDNGSNSLLSL